MTRAGIKRAMSVLLTVTALHLVAAAVLAAGYLATAEIAWRVSSR
jgi:hypothetical protein